MFRLIAHTCSALLHMLRSSAQLHPAVFSVTPCYGEPPASQVERAF
jgi:hypothetical protein